MPLNTMTRPTGWTTMIQFAAGQKYSLPQYLGPIQSHIQWVMEFFHQG